MPSPSASLPVSAASGVLDSVRDKLGIDRLELLSGGEAEGLSGSGVAAGRYVSRDVYVGAGSASAKPAAAWWSKST